MKAGVRRLVAMLATSGAVLTACAARAPLPAGSAAARCTSCVRVSSAREVERAVDRTRFVVGDVGAACAVNTTPDFAAEREIVLDADEFEQASADCGGHRCSRGELEAPDQIGSCERQGERECARVRIAAGSVFRVAKRVDVWAGTWSGPRFAVIAPKSAPCAAGARRLERDGECHGAESYCLSELALPERACACWTWSGPAPDRTACAYGSGDWRHGTRCWSGECVSCAEDFHVERRGLQPSEVEHLRAVLVSRDDRRSRAIPVALSVPKSIGRLSIDGESLRLEDAAGHAFAWLAPGVHAIEFVAFDCAPQREEFLVREGEWFALAIVSRTP